MSDVVLGIGTTAGGLNAVIAGFWGVGEGCKQWGRRDFGLLVANVWGVVIIADVLYYKIMS